MKINNFFRNNTTKVNLFWLACVLLVVYSFMQYSSSNWELIIEGATGRNQSVVVTQNMKLILWISFGMLLIAWSIYLFFEKKGIIRARFFVCTLLFIIVMIFWAWAPLQQFSITLLQLTCNPLVLIAGCFAMHLGSLPEINKAATQLCRLCSVLYLIVAMINMAQYYINYGNVRMGQGSIITYYSYALFFTAILICEDAQTGKNKKLYMIMCVLLVVLGVLTLSRGWMFQSLILVAIFYYKYPRELLGIKKIKYILVAFAIVLGSAFILNNYFGDAISTIIQRFEEDTRTGQLTSFFEQISLIDLIRGSGMNATYRLAGREYAYIDNQILLMLFWYGLFPTMLYIIPLVSTAISGFFPNYNKSVRAVYAPVAVLWLLALGGLSIYFGQKFDILNILFLTKIGAAFNNEPDYYKTEIEGNRDETRYEI